MSAQSVKPPAFLLVLLLLADVGHTQDDCSVSSCHPQLGDLMVGRGGSQLSASSTCGLKAPQNYCIIGYLEDEKKCFACDSRYPYDRHSNRNSHLIENVITTFEPERKMKWWQSENGVHHVSIQLDLENLFQFSHMVLTFKSFRPAAMLVERSKDNGRTWKVFRYFAENCGNYFPGVPQGTARSVHDVICDNRYSGAEPSTEGEVVLKALDPSFKISDPFAPDIQELITMTNLRVNFTRLLTLGDTLLGRRRRNPQDKYYYALYEMVVRGSCFCNGHASQCVPMHSPRGDIFTEPGMVHGRCVCQHNTAGSNCERCQEFYNDAPWRPASHLNPHPCKRCNCKGHSDKCHFDMSLYLASGGVSGGVCDDCQNNRAGVHCEHCRPLYYQDPRRPRDDPNACIPCECSPDGSESRGLCDPYTGRCVCKEHVEGDRCDRCKYGFYGLSQDDPQGCRICQCNRLGSVANPYPCDPLTGHCLCQHFATGPMCDHCLAGYWGLGNTVHSCSPCDCDIGGALHTTCNPVDGQCQCRPNMVGRRCRDPAPGYFLTPLDFYLYEAENARPLPGAASLVNPTGLPTCEQYFREHGYDFTVNDGKFVLSGKHEHGARLAEQDQAIIHLQPGATLQIVPRERAGDRPVTWTGLGFVRVQHGAGLQFIVDNLPGSLSYYLVIRYEPESSDDWLVDVKVTPTRLPSHGSCPITPVQAKVTLPGANRVAILDQAVCLSEGGVYHVDMMFQKPTTQGPHSSPHILVDSMGLIPKIETFQGFCSQSQMDEFRRYLCVQVASEAGPQLFPDFCRDLIGSLSAWIHNGAVACRCSLVGSYSQTCSKFGGQCNCKPNVIGRCCDTCAPFAFGLGPNGCSPCDCDPQGALMKVCDQENGQCPCRREVSGRRCDRCAPGYSGFPECRPCPCNGLAEQCDPVTGVCLDCGGNTAGPHCERCVHGYYGDPAEGEPCKPCLCPDTVSSGRFFAHSCDKDPNSLHVQCECRPGHTGARCDVCSPGYYGNLALPGARCQECLCNNNIDPQDSNACDPVSGECLRCLHNTYGPRCETCRPGYYGNALAQDCKACSCNLQGTDVRRCPLGSPCVCDQTSGQCPCLPGVLGTTCDQCDDGFWGLGNNAGCHPCDCDPAKSLSNQCNKLTGQCPCRPEFGGRRCDECAENFFGDPDLYCISCDCNMTGTVQPVCDRYTGECNCRPGVMGAFCDECAPGHEPSFPDCPPCHACWHFWSQNVTDLLEDLKRLSALVPEDGSHLRRNYSQQLEQLQAKLDTLANLTAESVAEAHNVEMLCQQVSMLKDATDPKTIIIDKIPILNAELEAIKRELDRLKILIKKIEEFKKPDWKKIEDALEKIRKYYTYDNNTEQQCLDAKVMLDSSMKTRQKAKEKLASCPIGDFTMLERRVKSLTVDSLNTAICGGPGDVDCSKAQCGAAWCWNFLEGRKCGGPTCKGALPVGENATKMAEKANNDIGNLLYSLKISETKIKEAKRKSQDTKAKAELLKENIIKRKEKIEQDKNVTRELIKRVKDYLSDDEFVTPDDIEKVSNAVLAIRLPLSPEEIRDLINKIQTILINSTITREELDHLQNQTRIVRDLLQQAKEVLNKTKSMDVDGIKKTMEEAEKVQDKVKTQLDKAENNINDTQKLIEKIKATLDKDETDLDTTRLKDLQEQIDAVKNKTAMNRLQAQEAKDAANSSVDSAQEANTLLDNVTDLFDELMRRKNDSSANDLVKEKLKNITMEIDKLKEEFENKTRQVEEFEKRIINLIQIKEEKALEVSRLLEEVTALRQEISEKAALYISCSS